MRHIWILIFLVLSTGCSKNADQASTLDQTKIGDKAVKMTGVFDPAAAAYILKPGTATIKTEVSSRGKENRLFRGRYAQIRLIPETAYAGEYLNKLFNGAKVARWSANVTDVDTRFIQAMRHGIADKQGKYIFYGVPAGTYYVYATARLTSGFFAVYERVTIAKGQTINLPLKNK